MSGCLLSGVCVCVLEGEVEGRAYVSAQVASETPSLQGGLERVQVGSLASNTGCGTD
jgi:hypothetical protein